MDISRVQGERRLTPPEPSSVCNEEHHKISACKYVRLDVKANSEMCYVWVRHCYCGQYVDKSHICRQNQVALSKEDGVDIHLLQACEWIQDAYSDTEKFVLKLICLENEFMSPPTPAFINCKCLVVYLKSENQGKKNTIE